MGDPLFITQKKLEEWIEEGEVLFEDDTLTIFAENASYQLESAVRVLRVLDGTDHKNLVGRVVSSSELAAMGAEAMRDSLIAGDVAYECEEGFVAIRPEPAPSAAQPEAAGVVSSLSADEKSSDMDMLADFLLKHL